MASQFEVRSQDGCVDWSKSLETTGGDEGILLEIAEEFIVDSKRLLDQILAAVSDGDTAKLKISSHSLKSSFGYFGVHAGASICQRIESKATEGDAELDNATLSELSKIQEATCDELAQYIDRNQNASG